MFEEFYQKYETEEQEVIALIRKCIGAGYHKSDNSDFWEMTVITLGMVFCNTGKVSIMPTLYSMKTGRSSHGMNRKI